MNKLDPENVHIRQNLHPKERYEITFTVHDAPGPFESAAGKISYLVSNEKCLPTQPISGGKPGPALNFPIKLTNTSAGTFVGYVYLDLPIDEDYFGLGVCHWVSNGAYIEIEGHGVTFSSGITQSEIVAQSQTIGFLDKKSYFDRSLNNYNDVSVPLNDFISKNENNFFYITTSAKKVAP